MDLKEIDILGESAGEHWYYVAKGRALLSFLKKGGITSAEGALIDVGAGSGFFSRLLLANDIATQAACIDTHYDREWEERHEGKVIRFCRDLPASTGNLVLMMDVLEHVDDDTGLLRSYAEKLSSGGYVMITVPAFRFLWSRHDDFLEHRRRYNRAQLHSVIEGAGLKPLRTRFFFGLLFPVIAIMRLISARRRGGAVASDLKPCAGWLNRLLIGIHDVERHSLFVINNLAGLSIFCLCRKP